MSSSAKEEIDANRAHCLRNSSARNSEPLSVSRGTHSHLSTEQGHVKSLDWSRASRKTRLLRIIFPSIKPPDRRRAERSSAKELVAYCFNGGEPTPYRLGNVSVTGLFLITEERWLPGTKIVITLQKEDCSANNNEDWRRVESKVVRWADDGVGFEFVSGKDAHILLGDQFEKRAFEQFVANVIAASS
jgi:hypothetical protein